MNWRSNSSTLLKHLHTLAIYMIQYIVLRRHTNKKLVILLSPIPLTKSFKVPISKANGINAKCFSETGRDRIRKLCMKTKKSFFSASLSSLSLQIACWRFRKDLNHTPIFSHVWPVHAPRHKKNNCSTWTLFLTINVRNLFLFTHDNIGINSQDELHSN